MNKRQKLVQEQFLNNEKAVISRLKKVYDKSLDDITKKASELQSDINMLDAMLNLTDDEGEKERLKSMHQSKVYQKNYQDALKKQVGSILDNMHVEEFKTVSEYLQVCYEDGFVGTMYDLQGQGIPLCFPLDQEAMVRAVQLDSKISQGLYSRLGEDVAELKKKITAQVSRGISTGMSHAQVAQQLAGYTNIGFNNAVRIARTEGHRIQVQSGMDACYKAKDAGADIVKQWDAALDARTRESHQKVDGEIRELDEKFSNGLMYPGDTAGLPEEVINCRCALLQRARWALDSSELETLRQRAEYFGLPDTHGYTEFKNKYNDMTNKLFGGDTEIDTFCKTYGITNAERVAVYDYMSSKSYDINEKLRNGTELTKEEKEFVETMNSALEKMPSYKGHLQRSLYFYNEKDVQKFLKDYETGNTINYNQFISTSNGKTYNPDGQVQIYIQDSKKGKNLSIFNPEEDEILYGTGADFEVLNMVEKDGKWYILLGEKS